MTDLLCCIAGCRQPAMAIVRGCSLCEDCLDIADEIPEYVPSRYVDGIIMEMTDGFVTGSDSLADALIKRGLRKPNNA